MNLKNIDYCLLKFRPSVVLGEQVNIGILFYFKEVSELKFIYPDSLARLSALFPNVDVNRIKKKLKNFKNRVVQFCKDKNNELLELGFDRIRDEYLLIPDDNSIFFSEQFSSTYQNKDAILKHYTDKYFSVYSHESINKKHSDEYLLSEFTKKINKKVSFGLSKRDYSIENKKGVSAKFDYAWQNGHINLIKPLSFDLKHKSSIQEKSVKWFGYLTQLEEIAEENNLLFNFLIAKPFDKELSGAYYEAVSILEEKNRIIKLIKEDDLDNYIEETESTIRPF
jgi:hypothetical protein